MSVSTLDSMPPGVRVKTGSLGVPGFFVIAASSKLWAYRVEQPGGVRPEARGVGEEAVGGDGRLVLGDDRRQGHRGETLLLHGGEQAVAAVAHVDGEMGGGRRRGGRERRAVA